MSYQSFFKDKEYCFSELRKEKVLSLRNEETYQEALNKENKYIGILEKLEENWENAV